jgi:hypothetical protein
METFARFLDECSGADTVITYFSGHGWLRADRLYLPLHDDVSKRVNRVDLKQLVHDFQQCDAMHRLVILDCCHATEGAGSGWTFDRSDRCLVLAASKFLEGAKESPELGGSIMTTKLVELLGSPPQSAMDGRGQVSVQRLFQRLYESVDAFRRDRPSETIPLPNLIGNMAADFPLGKPSDSRATIVLSKISAHPGWSLRQLEEVCQMSPEEFQLTVDELRQAAYIDAWNNVPILCNKGRQLLATKTG